MTDILCNRLQILLDGGIMKVEINNDAILVMQAILNRGNDVIIRRKKDGIVIMEESKKIQYDASLIGGKQGQ